MLGGDVRARVAEVFRLEYARLVASVLRIVRDVDAAEEIAQAAFEQAVARWPRRWLARAPGAWLLTTARRRALDRLRRARRAAAHGEALAYEAELGAMDASPESMDPEAIPDDRLRLIFTCCHPGLPADSRVALTLRLVGGLSTGEIARAFLVSEPTIAQRLVRAKRAIRDRHLPYEVPQGDDLTARLPAVLAVVYLIFNEGYAAHTGEALVRHDLCREALRLGEILLQLMHDQPEALGLVALMELQASRAAARTDADGNLVLLADQDRSRWDRARIDRGLAYLDRAGVIDRGGAYRLQAAIAACHARAASWEATDWRRDRRPLSGPRQGRALAGDRAELRGGDRPGGWARGRARAPSTSSMPRRCATTTSCPPPAPISSAGSSAGRRRPASIHGHSISPTMRASGPSSRRASRRAKRAQDPERPSYGMYETMRGASPQPGYARPPGWHIASS